MKVLIYCVLGTSVISQYCHSKKSFEGSTRLLPLPRRISSQVWLAGTVVVEIIPQKNSEHSNGFSLETGLDLFHVHRILEILQTNLWKTSQEFDMEA